VKIAKFSEAFNNIKERLCYFDDLREIKGEFFVTLKKKSGEKYTIPYNIMGDGFKALISLNLLYGQRNNSVILLEEPETGLHPGFMEILSEELIRNCKNKQMFITTHSEDLIKYLLEISEKMGFLDEILLLRLSKNQNIVDREILTKNEIFDELREIKLDLRGH
jgi:AAA15 family ATPase/GTPase